MHLGQGLSRKNLQVLVGVSSDMNLGVYRVRNVRPVVQEADDQRVPPRNPLQLFFVTEIPPYFACFA